LRMNLITVGGNGRRGLLHRARHEGWNAVIKL
jgi:hypothetical protein